MIAHRAADRVIVFDQKNPHLSLATIAGASVNAAEPIWSIKAEISHNEKHSSYPWVLRPITFTAAMDRDRSRDYFFAPNEERGCGLPPIKELEEARSC